MPASSAARSAAVISTRPSTAAGMRKVPRSSRLMLASQCPRSCGVIRPPVTRVRWAITAPSRLLSGGTALGDDQVGVPGCNPRVLPPGQPSEPPSLISVSPYDQVFSRRRPPRVDPSLRDPVVDLLRDDAEFPGQVGDPPFIFPDEVVAEQLPHEAQVANQRPDAGLRENAAAARGHEPLRVEPLGDLREVKPLAVELRDSFCKAPMDSTED